MKRQRDAEAAGETGGDERERGTERGRQKNRDALRETETSCHHVRGLCRRMQGRSFLRGEGTAVSMTRSLPGLGLWSGRPPDPAGARVSK